MRRSKASVRSCVTRLNNSPNGRMPGAARQLLHPRPSKGSNQTRRLVPDSVFPSAIDGVRPMSLNKRVIAEFIGTFWLVFGGCGSAVIAATFPITGIGLLGVSLAFGLTLMT